MEGEAYQLILPEVIINLSKEIKEMRDKGFGIGMIAESLSRSKGTISMEIKRNSNRSRYMPCIAHEKYKGRMNQQQELKIERTPILLGYIKEAMIKKKWSPDVIASRLKMEENIPGISCESIYRFIYTSSVARNLGLHSYLPSKKLKRQERGKRRNRIKIPQRMSIHEREKVAEQKLELGHFEADLTFHKGNQSMNIGSIVDKKTQRIMLILNLV